MACVGMELPRSEPPWTRRELRLCRGQTSDPGRVGEPRRELGLVRALRRRRTDVSLPSRLIF